jgi:hypothetical protein
MHTVVVKLTTLTKVVKSSQLTTLTKVVKSGQKWSKVVKSGQKWSIDHIDYRYYFRYVWILGGLQRTLYPSNPCPF